MCADLVTTLLLASDTRNTVLAAIGPTGTNASVYTPYGAQSAKGAVQNRPGFNGQLRERPTGWYHLGNGHRVYNPVLMRFHTPDKLSPFGKGGLNSYAYCLGDPVNLVDPTGQLPEWLRTAATVVAIVIALGGAAPSAGLLIAPRIKPVTPPLKGIRRAAAVMGVAGGTVAITSSGLLLAGKQEEAQLVSFVGALLTAPVSWMRFGATVGDKLRARALMDHLLKVPGVPITSAAQLNESFAPARPLIKQQSLTSTLSPRPAMLQAQVREGVERPDSQAVRGNRRRHSNFA